MYERKKYTTYIKNKPKHAFVSSKIVKYYRLTMLCVHMDDCYTHTHSTRLDRIYNSQVVCSGQSGFVEMFCQLLLSA